MWEPCDDSFDRHCEVQTVYHESMCSAHARSQKFSKFSDISLFLAFRFNELVYCLGYGKHELPLDSWELRGLWMGISEDVDNSLCYISYNESECTIVTDLKSILRFIQSSRIFGKTSFLFTLILIA